MKMAFGELGSEVSAGCSPIFLSYSAIQRSSLSPLPRPCIQTTLTASSQEETTEGLDILDLELGNFKD